MTLSAVTSCDKSFDNLERIEFNDTILRHTFQKECGTATGLLNVYVVYGKYKLADKEVPCGVALTPQGFKSYRIQGLLDKNPELCTVESIKASKEQKW